MRKKDDKYANDRPATHPLDLSPFHVGSLLNTPLHFFSFSYTSKTAVFQGHEDPCSSLQLVHSVVV
jgi:hypothetical protein